MLMCYCVVFTCMIALGTIIGIVFNLGWIFCSFCTANFRLCYFTVLLTF